MLFNRINQNIIFVCDKCSKKEEYNYIIAFGANPVIPQLPSGWFKVEDRLFEDRIFCDKHTVVIEDR